MTEGDGTTRQKWKVAIFEDFDPTIEEYKKAFADDGRFKYWISRAPRLEGLTEELEKFAPDLFVLDLAVGADLSSGLGLALAIRSTVGLAKTPILVLSNILASVNKVSATVEALQEIPGVSLLLKTVPFSVPIGTIAAMLEGG